MKANYHSLRFVSKLFILIFLLQSCSIYRSKPASVDRAVEFNRKVKLTTENNQVFKFKSLEREGTDLFGIARANSKVAKQMAENIVEKNYRGKFVKIGIAEDSVEEIKLKNYIVSAIVPIAVVIVVFAGFIALIASTVAFLP
ncbi:hypothetical protein [Gillisia limnaea]|uniref:Lipoprotein n=1 Tax=Gillisia limnaea (strain DSM 15749 / LMG 21470 / R-8282) TaxID=865937 RepID=H2BWL3_GILLR|nr:hypothetical protein [Gillisia limnaea]EHQ02991.1 hypothetical protein Gilli_2364 [Gillisia limnaea DSM 15749]